MLHEATVGALLDDTVRRQYQVGVWRINGTLVTNTVEVKREPRQGEWLSVEEITENEEQQDVLVAGGHRMGEPNASPALLRRHHTSGGVKPAKSKGCARSPPTRSRPARTRR